MICELTEKEYLLICSSLIFYHNFDFNTTEEKKRRIIEVQAKLDRTYNENLKKNGERNSSQMQNLDATDIKLALEPEFLVRSYSGRGMHGKTCVGIIIIQSATEIGVVAALLAQYSAEQLHLGDESFDSTEQIVEMFRAAKTDGMGLETILYFPNIEWKARPKRGETEAEEV